MISKKLIEQKDLLYFLSYTKETVRAPQNTTKIITIHDRAPPQPKFW